MKGKDHIATSRAVLNKMRKWFVGSCVQGGLWVRRVKAKFEECLQKMAKSWAQKTSHQEDPWGFRKTSHDLSRVAMVGSFKISYAKHQQHEENFLGWVSFCQLRANKLMSVSEPCLISAVGHLCMAAWSCKQCTTGWEEARPIVSVPGTFLLFLHKLGTRKLKCPSLLPPTSHLHLFH